MSKTPMTDAAGLSGETRRLFQFWVFSDKSEVYHVMVKRKEHHSPDMVCLCDGRETSRNYYYWATLHARWEKDISDALRPCARCLTAIRQNLKYGRLPNHYELGRDYQEIDCRRAA